LRRQLAQETELDPGTAAGNRIAYERVVAALAKLEPDFRAVIVLRELGAQVESHLPSRFDEGYGLAVETVERLAGEGVRLLVTVDCGITAVDAVARATELGVDVIVTDHHRPADALPACVRVCTRPSEYPFPELCGTGVVFKLAQALHARAGRDASELENHLDLVALATIADVVPLRDENRGLVRAGLRRLRRTSKPGLRALMAVARVDRAHASSTEVGFRLGNQLGRRACGHGLQDVRRRQRPRRGRLDGHRPDHAHLRDGRVAAASDG